MTYSVWFHSKGNSLSSMLSASTTLKTLHTSSRAMRSPFIDGFPWTPYSAHCLSKARLLFLPTYAEALSIYAIRSGEAFQPFFRGWQCRSRDHTVIVPARVLESRQGGKE